MAPKKNNLRGTKRSSAASQPDPRAAEKGSSVKRSRRLSERASLSQGASVTRASSRSPVEKKRGGGEREKATQEIDDGKGEAQQSQVPQDSLGRQSNDGNQSMDMGDESPGRPRNNRDRIPSPRTQASTETEKPSRHLSRLGAHEATTQEINAHPSMMPVDEEEEHVGPDPAPADNSIAPEGAGAMEDCILPRPPLDEGERVEEKKEVEKNLGMENSDRSRARDAADLVGGTTSSHGGKDGNESASDCDESPVNKRSQWYGKVSSRPSATFELDKRFTTFEREVKSMIGELNNKLDRVLNGGVKEKKDGDESDMQNVAHSLLYHLEYNVTTPSYIENKVLPLKMILNDGLHRRCVGKIIVDYFVRAMGSSGVTPKVIDKIAEVIRIVLYSKPVGGKKDTSTEDEDDLDEALTEMKKKMTFVILNIIQNDPSMGTQTLSVDGCNKTLPKPSWLQSGYTTSRHITDFYARTTRRKKKQEMAGDRDIMCAAIIRTVNEYNGKAFSKIRDRIRVDLMKEVFFIFENFPIELEKTREVDEGPVDLKKIPMVNIAKVPRGKVRKVLKKIWDGTLDIVGDQLTYVFSYDVDVKMKSGIVERKKLVRKMNFLLGAALILMRITGNGSFYDLLTYHPKIIHVIVCIAEMLVTLTEVEYMAKKTLEVKREECPMGEEGYNTLNVITCIRPTQSETRQEMLREHILLVSEDLFNKLMCDDDEDGQNLDESAEEEEKPAEEAIVGDDSEDDRLMQELDGAMKFLSKV